MTYVTVYYPIEKTTQKAVALRIDYNFLCWLPKSQCRFYKREINGKTQYKTIIPYWLAENKGLLVKDFNGDYVYISPLDITKE